MYKQGKVISRQKYRDKQRKVTQKTIEMILGVVLGGLGNGTYVCSSINALWVGVLLELPTYMDV